ncbi:MAG TPA: ABC transporter permease [Gemmatimonadaceae bacterium]
MTKPPAWRRYLRFWGANVADDVDEELRFHVDMRVQEYMARGLMEEEARRAVTARLGDLDSARAECVELGKVREKHARQADFLDGLRADVSFAFRSLARTPGWTAVALLTIALGIGATTTVFSAADTLLFRTIPYPHSSRVYMILREFTIDGHEAFAGVPLSAVREWREHARTIESVVPFGRSSGLLGTGADTITFHAALIDTGFLAFAGVHPLIGRNFTADETSYGGPDAVLLTELFWRRQYGGSRDVLGKVVEISGQPRTIIGVVPASFSVPDFQSEPPDVLLPLVIIPNRTYGGLVLARLKSGVSPAIATAELDAIAKRASVTGPRIAANMEPMPMQLRLMRPQDRLEIRQALVMLTGAVALLLLVACTNIAHLLLARGATRQRELAVRHALGADRARLLRQLVTESIVLALIGGALAGFVGWVGLEVLNAVRPERLVALSHVSRHNDILGIASVLALASGLVIGLLAALRIAHRELGTSLRAGASSAAPGGRRLRATLVVGEVALSTTLLVGALLLIHAVFDLQHTRLGFDARDLWAVSFPVAQDDAPATRAAFATLLRERAARIPGAEHATLAGSAPGIGNWVALSSFETPEHPADGVEPMGTSQEVVSADYFSVMKMPLLAGRTFDEGAAARHEVIINSSLAHELWPGGDAIGRRFRNAVHAPGRPAEEWQTVIGVVPDVVRSLVETAAQPATYQPLDAANDAGRLTLLVRLHGEDPAARLREFASTVRPDARGDVIESVREKIGRSMAEPRFTMRVLVVFALLGVLLSAIGLFGVISYNVGQRTREIGVRMTLGATRASIARLVVGDGIRLALIGTIVGLLGAVAATRLIQGLLYGVSPLDPFSFGLGAVSLLVISVIACAAPMLRATAVDPVIAVRAE